jgi:ribose 5-phosphate isomerase A
MSVQDPNLALKRAAAERAVEAVKDGMVLGLGTGSTAALAVEALGRRVQAGLKVQGIPTSEATAAQASALGIPLTDFARHQVVDLTIDGADAVDRTTFDLIKGLGGALLREKIVASASRRMLVIVDESKLAVPFGGRCPVPVEITRFGWQATERKLAALGGTPKLRLGRGTQPFVTDGGNFIVDCAFGAIEDAAGLEARLKALVGVIETGLFVNLATEIIIAAPGGVSVLQRG